MRLRISNRLVQLLCVLLVAGLISGAAFFLLYRLDNKYTSPGLQPINGMLFLSQEELAAHPVRHLVREWEFYPDVLLSPGDGERGNLYRKYISIGQYGGMDIGVEGRSIHGQGTYRLVLQLSDTPTDYAICLPEIYSAYRLYLNGTLMRELGTPEREDYRPEIRSDVLTFRAKGQVELLIAVSDYSYLYSGMVYPPSFGLSDAVLRQHTLRLIAHAGILLLSLIAFVLSLYVGTRHKKGQGILFALLCLSLIGYTSYPLLHHFFTTAVQPWYTLELFCGAAMLTLAAMLVNGLCGVRLRTRVISLCLGLSYCVTSAAFVLLAPVLELKGVLLFSALVSAMKWLVAGYMLVIAARAFLKRVVYSSILLGASVFFAFSLLADRVFSLYEPIYGGWFAEIGGLALVAALLWLMLSQLAGSYRLQLVLEQEKRQMEKQISIQKEHYKQLGEQIEETRAARHDLRQCLNTLTVLAQEEKLEEMKRFVERFTTHSSEREPILYTENQAADAIIQYYASRARREGIPFSAEVLLPRELPLTEEELCILLGNLLENALEACLRQATPDRFIFLRMRTEGARFMLVLDNSYSGELRRVGERFQSSKRDAFGIGTQSVERIVKSHCGLCNFDVQADRFCVSVIISLTAQRTACGGDE